MCSRVWGMTPSSAATHEQVEVDARGAGDHRADEALVAGHVDHRERSAARQLERRVAELDRDAAPLLLGRRSVSLPVSALTSAVLP